MRQRGLCRRHPPGFLPSNMSRRQTFLAKALYDNLAESADEIAFKRGDVLTVIEQDTGGLMGWWLCTFRGKQGIAPGNRLKILTGMIENGKDFPVYGSPSPSPSSPTTSWQRRSWDVTPNKIDVGPSLGLFRPSQVTVGAYLGSLRGK